MSYSLSSSSSLSSTAFQRNQISISSLTCNNPISRHASLSPPPTCTMTMNMNKSRNFYPVYRHHPYRMSHSMSQPGTSSAAMMMRSPPTSPPGEEDVKYYSPPTSPLYHYNEDNNSNDQLQERRQRNKAASAKYRQKKNMQQHEMRTMICQISDRNAMLERQLQDIRKENQQLRATADKLRGKLVATKLLRQWMQKHPQQIDTDNVEIDDEDELLLDDSMYDL